MLPVGMRRALAPRLLAPLLVALVLTLPAAGVAGRRTPWAAQKTPAPGPPQAIGAYSAGCIVGAEPLPRTTPELDVLRPGRHRHYGHPILLDFIRTLGAAVQRENLGRLRVGDLGQPRGGPAPSGHASHQIGLDVDLAFALGRRTAKDPLQVPMVDRAAGKPAAAFGAAQRRLLQLAAEDPRVARIFVNPVLKRALCEEPDPGQDRAWRARVRPWWGHDEHLHVRLACPPDSPLCRNQPDVGSDEGCADLDWWFGARDSTDRQKAAADYGKRVSGRPTLPAECDALLPPSRARRKSPKP